MIHSNIDQKNCFLQVVYRAAEIEEENKNYTMAIVYRNKNNK